MEQTYTPQLKNKKNFIAFIAALLGCALLILAFLTPFASANDKYTERFESMGDTIADSELNMTAEDMINLSLFDYARTYINAVSNDYATDIVIPCLVVMLLFIIFTVLTTVFTLMKKPVLMIIFSMLSLGSFILLVWDFADRKVVPGSVYETGFGQYLGYIGAAIVLIGAILLLILRKSSKNIQ